MILTINGGSSSIKFALFSPGAEPALHLTGSLKASDGIDAILQRISPNSITAIGHRLVHGGDRFVEPCRITPEVIAGLRDLIFLDPTHLPGELRLIEQLGKQLPNIPQFACFDTAFHKDMPRVAKLLPIPRRFDEAGIRKYGFHGLSYEFLLGELKRLGAAQGRIILAHLGNGSSLAAVRDRKSIDTSMCFTPAAGIMMGTRPGDLDPGVVLQIMRSESKSVDEMDRLLNQECGLKGVSATSADVRELLSRRDSDIRAAEAIDLYCYTARKCIGAFAAALGGVQTLVFSGGIGENAFDIRAGICYGLECLGARLDPAANRAGAAVISMPNAPCAIRVIKTNEELIIARAVCRLGGCA